MPTTHVQHDGHPRRHQGGAAQPEPDAVLGEADVVDVAGDPAMSVWAEGARPGPFSGG